MTTSFEASVCRSNVRRTVTLLCERSPTTPAVLVDTLRAGGLLEQQTSPHQLFIDCETLGHADASAGRLLAGSATAANAIGAIADKGELLTVSAQPGGALVRAPAGFTLTGSWRAVPAATLADWFVLVAQAESSAGTGTEPILTLLPAASATIGARAGVGLDAAEPRDVFAKEIAIPEAHVLTILSPPQDAPLPTPEFARCATAAVLLGVARRALYEFTKLARHRSRLGTVSRMAEQPLLQKELNRTVQAFRAARQLAVSELQGIPWVGADAGPASAAQRVTLAAAMLHARHASLEVVRFAFSKAGGSALYSGHPLELCWRDAETLACDHLFGEEAERAVAHAQFGSYLSSSALL